MKFGLFKSQWGLCGAYTVQIFLTALVIFQSQPLFAQGPCDESLASRDTQAFQDLVQKIRNDFEQTKSFSLFDYRQYFPTDVLQELVDLMRQKGAFCLDVDYSALDSNTRISEFKLKDGGLWVVEEKQTAKMRAIMNWFDTLLLEAFPPYIKENAWSQLRLAEGSHHPMDFRTWHDDGGTFSILISLDGDGPDVSLEKTPEAADFGIVKKLRKGQVAILSGSAIKQIEPKYFPTMHRTPLDYKGGRQLLIIHLYSVPLNRNF